MFSKTFIKSFIKNTKLCRKLNSHNNKILLYYRESLKMGRRPQDTPQSEGTFPNISEMYTIASFNDVQNNKFRSKWKTTLNLKQNASRPIPIY